MSPASPTKTYTPGVPRIPGAGSTRGSVGGANDPRLAGLSLDRDAAGFYGKSQLYTLLGLRIQNAGVRLVLRVPAR